MSERKWRRGWGCGCLAFLVIAFAVTAPITLMGPAVFLDSERKVLARSPSSDGKWTAQLEQMIVGGALNTVVTIRPSWQPDWYLTSCKALSHYGEASASLVWRDKQTLILQPDRGDWDSFPPFRWDGPLKAAPGCKPISVHVHRVAEICASSPPYDDSKYELWRDAAKAAHCPGAE